MVGFNLFKLQWGEGHGVVGGANAQPSAWRPYSSICDLTDMVSGSSAGGHYNPDKHPHGPPPNLIRHAGAFGNIQANKYGEAVFEFFDDTIRYLRCSETLF